MADRFAGKVVFLTGGASGIGAEAAARFHREGAQLVLFDRNRELADAVAVDLGGPGSALAVAGDVTLEADVAAACDAAVAEFGRIDVAVNSAGIGAFSPLVDHPLEQWQQVLDVCLTGTFLSTKHEARHMTTAGSGVIVNIASLNARVAAEGMAAYCCAKAGVEMLVRVAALELAPKGIRVCGISPGFVDTPLTSMTGDGPIRDGYLRSIPLGRAGHPTDIAAAIAFLASEDASWISGESLGVDGGEQNREYPRFFELFGMT